ncbi:MAG: efflux transporter outer membrane subunit, partial [Opitutales bacterium]
MVGCAHERAAEDRDETLPLPATYDRAEGAAEALPAEVEWFDFFAEPALEELIRRALEGNFELQAAWQRVERARALATQARAASWPRLQTEAGVQRERNQVRLPGSGGRRETYAETAYRASLGASYEIDLWGRLRSREEVATLRAEAGQADYRALAMTIAAEVTAAWLDLAELRLRGELLRDRREVARQQLELAERRLGMGQGSALDVTQQAQRVDALDAVLTRQSTALELTRHRLAALVGEAPQRFSVDGGATLPALRGRPPLGLPADLLERRPDVRAAWLRLRAADAETATAVADRLPRLQLDARLFTRATDPAGLLDTLLWSVGAGLSDTLFSGGREEAEVTAAEAAARDQLYTYAGALSTALREVADALAQ